MPIGASVFALVCHWAATALAALGVWLSGLPPVWMAATWAGIMLVSAWGWRSIRQQSAVRFWLVGERVYLLHDDPRRLPEPVSVRRSWHLCSGLFELQYRVDGQRRWRSLLVWPDSADSEVRRILRSHDAFQPAGAQAGVSADF